MLVKLADDIETAHEQFTSVFAGDAQFMNPTDARSAAMVIEAALNMMLMLAERAAVDVGDLDAPSALRRMREALWSANEPGPRAGQQGYEL